MPIESLRPHHRRKEMGLSPMNAEDDRTEPRRPSLRQALEDAKHSLSLVDDFSTNGTSTSISEALPHSQSLEIFQDRMLEEQRLAEPPPSEQDDGHTCAGRKHYAVSTRWELEYEAHQRKMVEASANRACCKDCHYCSAQCTCSMEDFYNYCCCLSKRHGNMFFLLEHKDGSPILVAGPCWPFCAFITMPLIIVAVIVVTYFMFVHWSFPWWVALLYYPVAAFTVLSLFMVGCRDPGLVERVSDEEMGRSGEMIWNEQTGSFRPTGAMYCRECKVLIEDFDHVCPWTGTGIGKGNMMAFRFFVASINILCYFSIILVAVAGIRSLGSKD